MNYDQIYAIAAQGMSVETLRVNVVAHNIANQHTLNTSDGKAFQPLQVMASAKPFTEYLNPLEEGYLDNVTLAPQHLPANKVYQPGHPAADRHGYVTYPGISTVDEMTTLLRAARAYEANVRIINAAHGLYLHALTIGEDR